MGFSRASGILLHPTSLPGPFGIGDLGGEAHNFIDFLTSAGQAYWQILPLNPTDYGDSPYQCFSVFAGNTLLISPEKLRDEGFLSENELAGVSAMPDGQADFGAAFEIKKDLLWKAFGRFRVSKKKDLREAYDGFCTENGWWLEDYALFQALRGAEGFKPWHEWEPELAGRDEEALNKARAELGEEIYAQKFYQFIFFQQWREL